MVYAIKRIGIAGLFFTCLFTNILAQEYRITVSAGSMDRSHTVVTFYVPDAVQAGDYLMFGEDGSEKPLQIDNENRAWFILETLDAGHQKTFTFSTSNRISETHQRGLTILNESNRIHIQSGEQPILSYFTGKNELPESLDERYHRGGYIHPVHSPNGVVLTNHLNVDLHPHHSGIWSAWTNTQFDGRTPDFWNVHQNTGRVDVVEGSTDTFSGESVAGFTSVHEFTDLSTQGEPVVALNEKWDLQVYRPANDYYFFDLTVTQTVNTDKPLFLPEYRYGGVGFRGHKDWDDPENMQFLTSEGLGRDGHATRVNWTHIGGYSDGELAGITIMGHPSNFRHPQTVRIHPEEPFFNFAPQQLGDMSIEPGLPYKATYRFITYDGEPNPERLNQLWNDFAYPPGVTVSKTN